MPRKKQPDMTKHTLWFFAGDFAKLSEFYPEIGASHVVRVLVRKHIEKIESQVKTPDLSEVEIDL